MAEKLEAPENEVRGNEKDRKGWGGICNAKKDKDLLIKAGERLRAMGCVK